MKTYREYLVAASICGALWIAGLIGAATPLFLMALAITSGLWPLAIPALLLYIPIGAFAAMVADRLDP